MFTGLGSTGTFILFACSSLGSALFFHFFLREIYGLSKEEARRVYSNNVSLETQSLKESLTGNKANIVSLQNDDHSDSESSDKDC